jgi:hypothetical protein
MDRLDDHGTWAAAIRRHFAQFPGAGDTLEGIARWWLGADPADWDQVQRALDMLEARREVERWLAADGRAHYRKAPPSPRAPPPPSASAPPRP